MRQLRDGVFHLVKEAFNVSQVIKSVCDIFATQAQANNVQIYTQIESNGLQDIPLLVGDKRRLKQVLINLIKNAIKFTNQGVIKVKAKYKENPTQML